MCGLILGGRPTVTREEWNEHLTDYITTIKQRKALEKRLRQAEIGINNVWKTLFGQEWDKNSTLPATACHGSEILEILEERMRRIEIALKEMYTAQLSSHLTTNDPVIHSPSTTSTPHSQRGYTPPPARPPLYFLITNHSCSPK